MPLIIKITAPTFTRPADTTAYGSGDLVANSTTAGSVTPLVFSPTQGTLSQCSLRRALIIKSTTTTANASFRLHLFQQSPVVSNGDNGAIAPTALASYNWVGSMSSSAAVLGGGTSGCGIQLSPDAGDIWGMQNTLYGLLEARGAYTPGNAETFSVSLFGALEA